MAHHVAELLTTVERAHGNAGRKAAEDAAVDLILKIWDHRTSIERINPFSDLRPVLNVLQSLTQKNSVTAFLRSSDGSLAPVRVYDLLRRLTILLCLLELGGIKRLGHGISKSKRTEKHQTRQELEVVALLSSWLDLAYLQDRTVASPRSRESVKINTKATEDIRAIAIRITEDAKSTLTNLSEELAKRTSGTTKRPSRRLHQ